MTCFARGGKCVGRAASAFAEGDAFDSFSKLANAMLLKPIEPFANIRRLVRCGRAMLATFENDEVFWWKGNVGGFDLCRTTAW